MKKHSRMRQRYFLRQLIHHLIIITLPILFLGILLTGFARKKLQDELTVYAERSKNVLLNQITDELNTFSEETALFSTTPTMALSISRLLNEQSLDYKNNVYKSIIPTIIGTTANMSKTVDSVYIYYDNPYGNYFSSTTGYTKSGTPGSTDSAWLSFYENSEPAVSKWVELRKMKHYSFEAEKEVLSVFRRFDYLKGVMVLNLDIRQLETILDANQIYQDSLVMVVDRDANILFGSSTSLIGAKVPDRLLHRELRSSRTYDTIRLNGTGYIYYSSSIPDYDLSMICLLPENAVFQAVNNMVFAFFILILFSILLSIMLSLTGTLDNFRQLQRLLELFSTAESGGELPAAFCGDTRNEYDLIFNNIVSTFVSNNRLQLNLAQAEVVQKDAQLAALQLQLNPHFIFNTLQTLDMEILKSVPDSTSSSLLIHNLSDILKYSLENTSRSVRISDEIAVCKSYAEIQKFRYSNPFILYWEYTEEVLPLPVIHLILQPILENSLHHGIKELSRNGLIKIKIFLRDSRIHFYVIDNGLGISRAKLAQLRESLKKCELTPATHIGLNNTNMRLILTYGPDAGLHIQSKEGCGTSVSFSVPAESPNAKPML